MGLLAYRSQADEFQTELSRLRAERDVLKTQTGSTTTADSKEQDDRQLENERTDVQLAAAELAVAVLPLERRETELLAKQHERLLAAKRKKLDVLKRRLAALREAKSRSRLETLQLERAAGADPIHIGVLDLQILAEKSLVFYFQRPSALEGLERRFPPRAMERISERIALSNQRHPRPVWDRVRRFATSCLATVVTPVQP